MKPQVIQTVSPLVLPALAGSILLASLGVSSATVALPVLAKVFSVGVQQVQWVVLAYLLAVTAAIVVAGRMGDLYGSRRVLVAGVGLFTLASVVCTLAPGLEWLIAGRVVQGLGAAVLMSLPMSMVKGLVAKQRIGTVMGLLGTMSAIGTALGPSLGGILIGELGWRAVFALLTLCSAGLLVLVLRVIPKPPKVARMASHEMDWAGSVWLSSLLLCLALLATGSRVGVAIPLLLGLAAVALLMLIRTELSVAHPLVPVALISGRALVSSLSVNLLVGAVMMSTLVVGPFFLVFGLGLSEAATGMVMAVGPIAAALSGVPAGWVTDRFGIKRTRFAGLLLAAGGLYGFASMPAMMGVTGYVIALALITPGFQLFLAANNTAVMLIAADEHKGLFSGLLGLTRNLGFMAGASLLPLLFASLLGSHNVAGSSAHAVGTAFSTTFLSVTGLCVLAILLAWWGNTAQHPALEREVSS